MEASNAWRALRGAVDGERDGEVVDGGEGGRAVAGQLGLDAAEHAGLEGELRGQRDGRGGRGVLGEQSVVLVPGVHADRELPQQLAGLRAELDQDAGLAAVDDHRLPVGGA